MFGTIILIVLVVLVGLAVVPRLLLPLILWIAQSRFHAESDKRLRDRNSVK
jgi:hypothetical protein